MIKKLIDNFLIYLGYEFRKLFVGMRNYNNVDKFIYYSELQRPYINIINKQIKNYNNNLLDKYSRKT